MLLSRDHTVLPAIHKFISELKTMIFTRDAMHSYACMVCAVVRCPVCLTESVCLSVRLSVTLVYCVETAKLTIKLFSSPGGLIILVFP